MLSRGIVLFEEAVSALEQAVGAPETPEKMHAVIASVHRLSQIYETTAVDPELVAPLRRRLLLLHAQSPFIRRLQEWPRGYPGDFETVEMMCDAHPSLARSHSHYWLEWYALHSGIVLQHRNKIAFQHRAIFHNLKPAGRVLSIGCGGGRDLLSAVQMPRATISLVDIEADALALAESRARRITGNVTVTQTDALRALRRCGDMWSRIVFGGLFDYFADKTVIHCLRRASEILEPGGRIIFTNVAAPCPFRAWIDLFTNWQLILRREEDISSLMGQAGLSAFDLRLSRDPSSLSLLCEIMKPDASEGAQDKPASVETFA